MEGVGLINPAPRVFGHQSGQALGDLKGIIPTFLAGVDAPAHLEHRRVLPEGGGDMVQLRGGFAGIAQVQPATGGFPVVPVRRLQR